MRKWKVNAVALPLNEACWLGGFGGLNPDFSGEPYRQAIEDYVARLNARGIYVVLRLSGTGPGDNVYGSAPGDSEMPMADADHSLDFWTSVAEPLRRQPRGRLPRLRRAAQDRLGLRAQRLRGQRRRLRGRAGVRDVPGRRPPGDRRRDPRDRRDPADHHLRDRLRRRPDRVGGATSRSIRSTRSPSAGTTSTTRRTCGARGTTSREPRRQRYPIVIGGFGDTDCNSDFSTKLMRFADGQGISYLAWTWNTEADYGGCSNALLGPNSRPTSPATRAASARASASTTGASSASRRLRVASTDLAVRGRPAT